MADVIAAARMLIAVPADQRRGRLRNLFDEAGKANAYRRQNGRPHPLWGDGSLMSAALRRHQSAEPSLDDRMYRDCLILVLQSLRDRAAGDECVIGEACAQVGRRAPLTSPRGL